MAEWLLAVAWQRGDSARACARCCCRPRATAALSTGSTGRQQLQANEKLLCRANSVLQYSRLPSWSCVPAAELAAD